MAVALAGLELGGADGDGEIGLARAGGTDAEDEAEIVLTQLVEIGALAGRLRHDGFAQALDDFARSSGCGWARGQADGGFEFGGGRVCAIGDAAGEGLQRIGGEARAVALARDDDLAALGLAVDAYAIVGEGLFEQLKVCVRRAADIAQHLLAGDRYGVALAACGGWLAAQTDASSVTIAAVARRPVRLVMLAPTISISAILPDRCAPFATCTDCI